MRKTWKPTVAGILLTIVGAGIPISVTVVGRFYPSRPGWEQNALILGPLFALPIWLIPLAGSVLAIRRRWWKFTLTSSIIALSYMLPLGLFWLGQGTLGKSVTDILLLIPLLAVPVIVLVSISKGEFEEPPYI